MSGFAIALALAFAFAVTNGIHDAANAIAALVATRAARPTQALVLAACCTLVGPFLAGGAVAATIAGVVSVPAPEVVATTGAALVAATSWNIVTLSRGVPSSSSHALVGGLAGSSIAAGGWNAVRWGGWGFGGPIGLLGVLLALVVAPVLGFTVALLADRLLRRVLVRASSEAARPVRGLAWATSSVLALSHGANDAGKAMGVVMVLLVADGHGAPGDVPRWVVLASAAALTFGTAFGGWGIVRTIGRRIYRLRPADGLASTASASVVVVTGSALGLPLSTSEVTAAAVAGAGFGRRRRHVHWRVARAVAVTWLTTVPVCAMVGSGIYLAWRTVL